MTFLFNCEIIFYMNTYLIVSNVNYYILEKIKEIQSNISNIITFNMLENNLDEILEEASYYSMFGDMKLIIVKNAKLFSTSKESELIKKDREKLLKYLENENENTKLVFINDKVDTKIKLYKLLSDSNNVFVNNKLTKTDIKNEIIKVVNSNNYTIDDRSVWYIINNSLNNLDLAVNEINKIMLYYDKPCKILYEDVLNITAKSIDDNSFKLVDSIINKDYDLALRYLNELKLFKIDPSIIVALLYREFRLMLLTILYEEDNINRTDIIKKLKLADWQFDKVNNNLNMYSKKEIKNNLVYLNELDYEYKSGKISKDILLIEYILNSTSMI